jgi:hypothetical protein
MAQKPKMSQSQNFFCELYLFGCPYMIDIFRVDRTCKTTNETISRIPKFRHQVVPAHLFTFWFLLVYLFSRDRRVDFSSNYQNIMQNSIIFGKTISELSYMLAVR